MCPTTVEWSNVNQRTELHSRGSKKKNGKFDFKLSYYDIFIARWFVEVDFWTDKDDDFSGIFLLNVVMHPRQ